MYRVIPGQNDNLSFTYNNDNQVSLIQTTGTVTSLCSYTYGTDKRLSNVSYSGFLHNIFYNAETSTYTMDGDTFAFNQINDMASFKPSSSATKIYSYDSSKKGCFYDSKPNYHFIGFTIDGNFGLFGSKRPLTLITDGNPYEFTNTYDDNNYVVASVITFNGAPFETIIYEYY